MHLFAAPSDRLSKESASTHQGRSHLKMLTTDRRTDDGCLLLILSLSFRGAKSELKYPKYSSDNRVWFQSDTNFGCYGNL